MTLRLRLALSLAVLLALGLVAFGLATYAFYAPTQYAQLDTQLRASESFEATQLELQAHVGSPPGATSRSGGGDQGEYGSGPAPTSVLAPGSYAALLSPAGKVVASADVVRRVGVPRLPSLLQLGHESSAKLFDAASSGGTGPHWRVLVSPAPHAPGYLIVLAEPTTAIDATLHDLLLVEVAAALGLLLVLLAGSWLILRRGLSPLEHMALDSRAIASGDLSRRVGPERGPTEVIELGAALNAMLADIERAFAERDVTEARLRQFLADVSHELRTPLTSIQGFAELFRLSIAGGERSSDPTIVARRIEEEAGRMKRLVDDLLLLARLDQAPEMLREDVDLSVVVAEACSAAAAIEPGRPLLLDAPEPVHVLGDAAHLRQAVANLLTNGLRHTPPGSPIEVALRHEAERGDVVVSVRDHGPGLDEEALAKAFDRFWRADRSRAGGGAGLGLSIVAAVADEHGGSVTASNADGGGAQFVLRLPTGETKGPTESVALPGKV